MPNAAPAGRSSDPSMGRRIVVVGGGAAGFFAAITCAEAAPGAEVILLEKGPQFLAKVRISGGGRCNVTHACFDPREFSERYPRGERVLVSPFNRFQASDTVEWFAARGVRLKTENDGRMFPVTDSSQTIIDCLLRAAREARVKLALNCGVQGVVRQEDGRFEILLTPGNGKAGFTESAGMEGLAQNGRLLCDRLLLATGGCRAAAAGELAVSLGHTLAPPVPSLFTFQIASNWLRELSGVTVNPVELWVAGTTLRERGALLVTHWGLSGPVVLRLSAWGARELHGLGYKFPLLLNWLPESDAGRVAKDLEHLRQNQPAKYVVNTPLAPLPSRLWEQLVLTAGIPRETRWASLNRAQQHDLVLRLTRTELPVTGKSLNKDEFVTCGGVKLGEVNFKTMESRICPSLFFAGELLDIDGITGGFNFQSAWTTGWLAGRAMADD